MLKQTEKVLVFGILGFVLQEEKLSFHSACPDQPMLYPPS